MLLGVAVPVHTLDWLTADLVAALGPEQVSTSEAVRGRHAAGESYHRGEPPDVVVFPRSTSRETQSPKPPEMRSPGTDEGGHHGT
jgi:hypothetical protein